MTWNDLTPHQQREIIHALHHETDEQQQILSLIRALLMKKNTWFDYYRMRKTLRNTPISNLVEQLQFLNEKPTLYEFPHIKGLQAPAPRMGDITIEQYALCDTLYHRYLPPLTPPEEGNAPFPLERAGVRHLRQLVACIYRLPGKGFDKQLLPQVAKNTDLLPVKELQRIAFIFFCIKLYIADSYPSIFKPKTLPADDAPVFGKKQQHTPFSQIIVIMAADELRLLGNLNECKKTLLYDFFSAFLESRKIHKQQEK